MVILLSSSVLIYNISLEEIHPSFSVSPNNHTLISSQVILSSALFKLSIVVNKSQTTRKVARGIYTDADAQIVFVDTPGLHKANSKLGTTMNEAATSTLEDVDVVIFVVDAKDKNLDRETIEIIKQAKIPAILVINKIDLIGKAKVASLINSYKELYEFNSIIPTSIKKGTNNDVIIPEIKKLLKEGPKFYDEGTYTDQNLREMTSEIIRQKTLKLLDDEIPHGIFVEVTKMKTSKTRTNEKIFNIDASIYCVRESHKGIIIGKNGQMLKRIGTYAREDIEKMVGRKVNLQLWVKVKKDWINDNSIVKQFKNKV